MKIAELKPHIIINAGAGSGKTTTITESVSKMYGRRPSITFTEEQAAICDAMQDQYPGRVHMTSFTVDAAEQLAERCPISMLGEKEVTSSSTYGMGLRFAKEKGEAGVIDRWGHKYRTIVTDVLGAPKVESDKKRPGLWEALVELQSKIRLDLKKTVTGDDMVKYANNFGIDLEARFVDDATTAMNGVLAAGRENYRTYDFTDMVYLPNVKNYIRKRYETLVVDEFQDMNLAQQELCLGVSHRRVLIGDPHQAIYGFAGADNIAFDRITAYLNGTQRGVRSFPLNESRRCAKRIVARANELVDSLRAMPSAPEGEHKVYWSKGAFMDEFVKEIKDVYDQPLIPKGKEMMIICPTNAPLISLMFKLQKRGIRSYVHGKDITESMQRFIAKCDKGIVDLREQVNNRLDMWLARKPSKTRDLQVDLYSAIAEIAEQATTVNDVRDAIASVFSDEPRPGWLKMCSIHRSKGLEAGTVVIWEVNNCKSKWSRLPWEHQQDINLEYVAITRAKHRLVEVLSL